MVQTPGRFVRGAAWARVAAGLAPAASYAGVGDQLVKLVAADGEAMESFGFGLAIGDGVAVVGARHDDDNGFRAGSVYLFDAATGAQVAKLLADEGAPDDVFGWAVGIDGETIIVGAPAVWNPAAPGCAYLFDSASGLQIATLTASDAAAGDSLGLAVALGGGLALVGAIEDDDNGGSSGSAYLFDAASGEQLAKMLPDDGAPGDRFGQAVAIGGGIAVVSAYTDRDNGAGSGSVYVFDVSHPSNPTQLAKILPDDGAAGDLFGFSLALDGTTAIIGCSFDDAGAGAAYLFDLSDPASPIQAAKLVADDRQAGDGFGVSVGIAGGVAIVGAYQDDDLGDDSGAAYLFDVSDQSSPTQIAKLRSDDGATDDMFGRHVAIAGRLALCGAYGDDDHGEHTGSAYLFDAGMCAADFNGDGLTDSRDVIAFLNAWAAGDAAADFDGNGVIDSRDAIGFLNAWVSGC